MILRYILDHSDMDPVELRSFLADNAGDKAKEAFMTGAEKLRQEGREKGRDEALRGMLTRQLRQRFGELPSDVIERVGKARTEQLELWGDRFATSDTLDQVFSGTD